MRGRPGSGSRSPIGGSPSMFRRSALPAAAALAVVLLAVTGCKIQVSGAAPGSTSTAGAVQAGTSGVTRSGPLIVEPGAGFSPVYSLINGARHPDQLLQLLHRLLHPRQGGRGRLRHQPREDLH